MLRQPEPRMSRHLFMHLAHSGYRRLDRRGRRCSPGSAYNTGTRALRVLVFALISFSASAEDSHARYDWVPVEDMSPEQLELLRPGCCGRSEERRVGKGGGTRGGSDSRSRKARGRAMRVSAA